MIFRRITFSFFISLFPFVANPQVDWRINSEAGFYESSGDIVLESNGPITRLDSYLKYKHEAEKRSASLQLRFRPELYSFNNPVSSIKLKAEGDYYQGEENFDWGLNLTGQKNFLNTNTIDYTYDIFVFSVNTDFSKIGLNANGGYAYQIIKGRDEYNLDLLFLDVKSFSRFSHYIKFGYGLYLERFFVSNKIILINNTSENKNEGWRTGPQISLTYLKDYIVNIDYRLLFHESEFTKNLSYEHWIRVVAGKIFLNYFSAFLLADYSFYRFIKSSNYIEAVTPLYTPLNSENKIYLKIAYEIKDNLEIYTKTGYFRDNLYEDSFSLEGWNAMIGIELNGGI
jgi:hypothetical protein